MLRPRSPARLARALLVVVALVAHGLMRFEATWPAAPLLVLAAAWAAGAETLVRLREPAGPFPLGRRVRGAAAGGAAFALALLVFDLAARLGAAWPTPVLYLHVRGELVEDAALVGGAAVLAALLLPARLLAAEAADPTRAVLGWAAVGALSLFAELTPLRLGRDIRFERVGGWTFVLSLAFVAGWAAAARAPGPRPRPARTPAGLEPLATAGLVLLALVGVYLGRGRANHASLVVLVTAAHLVVLRERLRGRPLADLAGAGLVALGLGVAVHWLVPRPALRCLEGLLAGGAGPLVPMKVALAGSVAAAAWMLLLLVRPAPATDRP